LSPILVFVLFGPTASGKTEILFRLFGPGGLGGGQKAEIVSADSMQVYRGMDIGTAKPSPEEQERLPHHLINIRNPDEQFNTGDFVRLAREAITGIARRGALPVVAGGTGFYLKNLVMGLPEAPPSDGAIRSELKRELHEKGAAALMGELARFDPASAGKIHQNDEYRLLRALEVLRVSGRPLSSFQTSGAVQGGDSQFDFRIAGLFRPREELYKRIDVRCATMFAQGLPDEVRKLHEAGYSPRDPGIRAIGYREFFVEELHSTESVYRLSRDLVGVQALTAQNSRRYAKRQETFFASLPGAQRITAGENDEETARRLWDALEKAPREAVCVKKGSIARDQNP
jgi:tRNA dimethylallyltransferase